MRRVALLALLAAGTAVAQEAETPPGQVSLDDVWCTVCHWEQGDQFALSVHYRQGQLLCNDCHGGDPTEADPALAKAPETGFSGRPARESIAALCGGCHSGPAGFFAQGPHHETQNRNNPTCITCHHNHSVLDATLALMDTTCAACHAQQPAALATGARIQASLRAAEERLAATAARFDSLSALEAGLRRSAPRAEAAASALRSAAPRTHALDGGIVGESLQAFDDELAGWQQDIDAAESHRLRRHWAVLGVWLFVAANVLLLWIRRRQL